MNAGLNVLAAAPAAAPRSTAAKADPGSSSAFDAALTGARSERAHSTGRSEQDAATETAPGGPGDAASETATDIPQAVPLNETLALGRPMSATEAAAATLPGAQEPTTDASSAAALLAGQDAGQAPAGIAAPTTPSSSTSGTGPAVAISDTTAATAGAVQPTPTGIPSSLLDAAATTAATAATILPTSNPQALPLAPRTQPPGSAGGTVPLAGQVGGATSAGVLAPAAGMATERGSALSTQTATVPAATVTATHPHTPGSQSATSGASTEALATSPISGTPVPESVPAASISAAVSPAAPAPSPAASAAPTAASPAAPTPTAPLNTQLATPLFSLANAGRGEHVLTINITPDNLGPVTVRAHVTGEGVRVELFAPTDLGRDALRAIMPDLRRDLAGTGMNASLDLSSQNQPTDQNDAENDAQSDAQRDASAQRGAATAESATRRDSGELTPERPAAALYGAASTIDVMA